MPLWIILAGVGGVAYLLLSKGASASTTSNVAAAQSASSTQSMIPPTDSGESGYEGTILGSGGSTTPLGQASVASAPEDSLVQQAEAAAMQQTQIEAAATMVSGGLRFDPLSKNWY